MTFTELITFLLIGIGLSFDSFAVSVSCGLMKREILFKQAAIIAAYLAFFQAGFPVIGWFIGNTIQNLIASFDHWIAFGLLAFIGIKMIIEGVKENGSLTNFNPFKLKVLIGLSIATSIDALVVGLSFGFLDMPIWFPVIVIGVVTFIASMLGMLFGKYIPAKRSRQSLILGGIILISIGGKILIEHLWF
jgi:putative Mn2+ efflux pump MntP